MTLEAIVRSILERAVEDGLVAPMETFDDPDPQSRTDEELRGCCVVLRDLLRLNAGQPAIPPPHRSRQNAQAN